MKKVKNQKENNLLDNMVLKNKKSKFTVKIETADLETYSWDLLTEENLKKVGIKPEDIKNIDPFFHVPGKLYTEPGVAKETHPCSGSIGVWIYTYDGHKASIQDIIYYDFNPHKTHYGGLPHWNHERRLITKKGEIKRLRKIESHIIKDSEKITIYFNGKKKTVIKELDKNRS